MRDEELTQPSVLLVDDTAANLLALEAVLSSLKVPMVSTRSGPEALAFVERRPFAVALVDVQMPAMDGFELAQRLRQTPHGRELPILFVTAIHRDEDFVRRGYAVGGADYITKPFDPQVVRARVRAFLDLYRQREAVRRRQVALRTQERDEAIRRLVAFERIAAAALETQDLPALLNELLHAFLDAADAADSAAILLREGDYLRAAAAVGAACDLEAEGRLRVGAGIAGLIALERRPLELDQETIVQLAPRAVPLADPVRALYGTPLMHDGQLIGVAHIGSTRAAAFSPQEKRLFLAATERAALAVSKQLQLSRLNQVLTTAPACIAIVSADTGTYLFANPPLRQLFDQDLLGRTFSEIGFGEQAWQAVLRAGSNGDIVQMDELCVETSPSAKRAGAPSTTYVRFSAQPLLTSSGEVDRVLVFAVDISEQIRARRELEETERLRMLLLQREREARVAAEAASRAKDEFLATVSHELRTPLNAILGWAALARSNRDADVPRALAVIERNAHAQARIVEDVLDFARVSRGELRLTRTALNFREVLDGALEAVRPSADARGIQIQLEIDLEQPVFGDAERLRQVILNLLANAVKYSEANGVVSVSASSRAGLTTFRVSDHGRGIEPEFLPHVFEPFRQADGSTTRRHGGLGLGLAIAKQLVHAHGGVIEAQSDGPGTGAAFTVELPSQQEFSSKNPEARDTPVDARPAGLRLRGIKVLVVDDDDDGRELVAETLAAHGAVVSALASPVQALQDLAAIRPDVLVSDISMPELDGYQLLLRVRALPAERGGAVPALALTAHAGEDVPARALGSGFQRYLSKPIDVGTFVALVAELAGS